MMAQTNQRSFAAARAALPNGYWHRLLARMVLVSLVAAVFFWLLANQLADIPLAETRLHLFAVAPGQWLTAVLATIVSFWAVGHYDGVIHRHLATGARPADARRAGAAAIAVSQTLGFGLVTGAILRWRMLPDQTLWQSAKITTFVALFFLFGWAAITAFTLVVLPDAPFKTYGILALIIGAGVIVTSLVAPRFAGVQWPNAFVICRLLGLAAVDTMAAAAALSALCPPDLILPFATLLPAFLLALGAGLVSGTPGGAGAFEITFFALLPLVPQAPLLAAILAWRAIYYAGPALVGAGLAIWGPARKSPPAPVAVPRDIIRFATRAEAGLLAQGNLGLLAGGRDHAWLSGRSAHCLIALLDPICADVRGTATGCDHKRAITALIDTALSESKWPVIYKCTARTAVAARQLGLSLHPIAREAYLDPRAFTLSIPSRAGLRRKLRHATAAGITVTSALPDWPQLAQIAKEWAFIHHGERGFSMGKFDRSYLQGQRLYVANRGGEAVAFASFHIGREEWTLDLMRSTATMPDGGMQALIMQAIADAAALDLPRLSLAAVPFAALAKRPTSPAAGLIHRLLGGDQTGLAQFKSAFVPNWQTLYLAAPHRPGLALSAAEIARAVRFPPLACDAPHDDLTEYEIATVR